MTASPFPALSREVTLEMVTRYGEVNRDRNMLHYETEPARAAGYEGPIVHGALSAAILSQACAQAFGPGWPAGGRLEIRFRRPLAVGDTLTTGGEEIAREERGGGDLVTYRVWCKDSAGHTVIEGTACALAQA